MYHPIQAFGHCDGSTMGIQNWIKNLSTTSPGCPKHVKVCLFAQQGRAEAVKSVLVIPQKTFFPLDAP
jgi:hypothetical protein